MKMNNKQNKTEMVQEFYRYMFYNIYVKRSELIKKFGKNFEELMSDGKKYLNNLGLDIKKFKRYLDKDNVIYVLGINGGNYDPIISAEPEITSIFFVAAYYIYKHGERVLLDEFQLVFNKYLNKINTIIIEKNRWLEIKENYIYIHPLGKYVLYNFLRKNPDTNKPLLIEKLEEYIYS